MSNRVLPLTAQVIVVGGGPAGASTAWHCATAGLNVLLLDRARFPRPKPCAEYVSPEAARILLAMGALPAIEQQAASLTGMVVHAPSGERIRGEFVAAHGFRGFRDAGLGIRRESLDQLLVDRARAAGVHVVEGAKVESLVRAHDERVTGVVARTNSGTHTIAASLVVGADGLHSIIARRLHLARRSRWPRRTAFVAHFCNVAGMSTLGEMHVKANGYVGLADVGDGVTNVALVVPTMLARDAAGDPDAFLVDWLQASTLAARFVNARRVSVTRATGPFASQTRQAWSPGAALVGDAADFFDPFTGEGIYAALRGGELLAPHAAACVRATERGDAAAAQHALRDYDRNRRAAFAGKWRVERIIGAAVSSPFLMNLAARVLGRDRALADLLIGVTGDFVPAAELLRGRTMLRVVSGLLQHGLTRFPPDTLAPTTTEHVHRS